MHPLYGAQPVLYVPMRVTWGTLVAHRYTHVPPRCRTSQDLYFPLSVPVERSYWPCIRWCGTGGFQEQYQCLFIGLSCSIPCRLLFFPISSFLFIGRYCGAWVIIILMIIIISKHLTINATAETGNRSWSAFIEHKACALPMQLPKVQGDLNAKVGNEVIVGIVLRVGVQWWNESVERLQERSREHELVAEWFVQK